MKPEHLEITQLKREKFRLKAERDILRNCNGPLPGAIVYRAGIYCVFLAYEGCDWLADQTDRDPRTTWHWRITEAFLKTYCRTLLRLDGALIAHLYRQIDAFPFSTLACQGPAPAIDSRSAKASRITKNLGASGEVPDVDQISKGGAGGGAERASWSIFRQIKQGAAGITTAAPHIADQWGRGDDRLPGLREPPGTRSRRRELF